MSTHKTQCEDVSLAPKTPIVRVDAMTNRANILDSLPLDIENMVRCDRNWCSNDTGTRKVPFMRHLYCEYNLLEYASDALITQKVVRKTKITVCD